MRGYHDNTMPDILSSLMCNQHVVTRNKYNNKSINICVSEKILLYLSSLIKIKSTC